MIASEHFPETESSENGTQTADSSMNDRKRVVWDHCRRFASVIRQTGLQGENHISDTEKWIRDARMTGGDDQSSIVHREEFFVSGFGQEIIKEGIPIHDEFFQLLQKAEPYISTESKKKWLDRYYDSSVEFQAKKYWIRKQFPSYVDRWIKAEKERDELEKSVDIEALISYDQTCSAIKDKEEFKKLHFNERIGLLAKVKALRQADKKMVLDLYSAAEKRLAWAEDRGFIARGKTGVWLERIFKSKRSNKAIEEFVKGEGGKTLGGYIGRWSEIRKRYDGVASKLKNFSETEMPRGLYLLQPQQFLSLHYDQRVSYVEEMESRLNNDILLEPDSFIRIRHAMDMKDWDDAVEFINQAKTESLSGPNRVRLASMELYIQQLRPRMKVETKLQIDEVTTAKNTIDSIVPELDSSVQPMVMALLKGPNANRSMHQLRWVWYNNLWCRARGYLDDDRLRKGAGDDCKELTKYRAKHGEDIGRDDVLDYETADQQYFRKKEFSNHSATNMHINLKSGGVMAEFTKWVGREQESKVLYWGNCCPHEDGHPKPESWMSYHLPKLTRLRAATKVLKNAGMLYNGPGMPLSSLN
ncbi:hypothetical protein A3A67_05090 [Candidatus Peribacteria bacterium RIFCSPLOWO2_01_FULL_51_18]|nr:MAG: hypothetical protein A3C52_01195 [Candidatus Peribacteria bacterium RIFCSPHIGHO2_02_FULL_51_15]OGJ66154.1 MAG: hypothetical protein A3A67_05090 [Candidatus Peribacteria bacterium RIFCSPLOWO2_01_FULL_51_18]OGJ68645.1 MAG: hypothetical protein A3J34_00265 [Candidatus Peribacteria bacterium RIFCSPLOWO2_02_FULL_51_10]